MIAAGAVLLATGCGGGGSSSGTVGGSPAPPPASPGAQVVPVNIAIQPAAAMLNVGQTQSFTATEVFSDGSTQDVTGSVTWSSSNGSAATIAAGGKATGSGTGLTTVTATSGALTGYTMITVGATLASASTADFYVATNGNDAWSGKLPSPNGGGTDGPFLTLDRARRAVAGKAGSTVQIRAGTYFVAAPVQFAASDSGSNSAPIRYENYPGETPVISGGTQITGWINTGSNVWTTTLPATYRNFEALYFRPAGSSDSQRRMRPRTATTGSNCSAKGYLCSASDNPIVASSKSTNCGLQVSNGYQCFDQFRFNPGDMASSYHAMALGDVEVLDFENWSMSRLRLASVDTTNNIAHLTSPTVQGSFYGFLAGHRYLIENCSPGANGTPADAGCSASAGEWYLDRCPDAAQPCTVPQANWTLTYWANSGEDLSPGKYSIIAPQQAQVILGDGASNIVFRGLTFAHDNWIPGSVPVSGVTCKGECGLGDQSGMPHVSAGISFTNSQRVVFDSCTFAHTQGWGVEFVGNDSGTSMENQVVNSLFYDLGSGGVRIGRVNGLSGGTDSEANIPQYNLVQNNLIAAGGRVQPTGIGTGVWIGNAHHNMVAHNEIFDFYNGAIGLGIQFGQGPKLGHDNVAAYNLLYDLGQGVTSDMGGVHTATGNVPGTLVLNNVIHDVTHDVDDPDGYGGNGLYLDTSTSFAVVQNNLVYRVSWFGAVNNTATGASDTTAQHNVFLNNIIAFSAHAAIQRNADNIDSFSFVRNITYLDKGNLQSGRWTCADVGASNAAVPCSQRFLLDRNDYWSLSSPVQFFTTAGNRRSGTYNLSQWQALGEDTHSVTKDPLFVAPGYAAGDDYTLQSSSPALSLGFQQIDARLAGRSNPVLDLPTVSCGGVQTRGACPTFPLQLLDPATGY